MPSTNLASSSAELVPLASTIVAEIPKLIERTLKHEVENNALTNQCADLKTHLNLVKDSITIEREEHIRLRARIEAMRGVPRRCSDNILPTPIPMPLHTGMPKQSCDEGLLISISATSLSANHGHDSPLSTRSKRKGIIFAPEEVRFLKKPKVGDSMSPGSISPQYP